MVSTVRKAARWRARRRAGLAATAAMAALVAQVAGSGPLSAATVPAASFSGGTGTATVEGTVYAKVGGALTLTVTTTDAKCVQVSGAHTGEQTSNSVQGSWSFTFTAGTGDGVRTVTATAFKNQNCKAEEQARTASYVVDNTAPVVTGALAPTPNAAGWNRDDVTVTWSATDAGSGVASGQPVPATSTVTADTSGVARTATAADRLGNSATGSVVVKLDKTAPTISGTRSPAANANGWNNGDVSVSFTCADGLSGVTSCSGPSTLTGNGAGQSVTGNAVDQAGSTASATVGDVNIDKAAPTLSGAPTTSPNSGGWYAGDVTVAWSCADPLSGLAGACPPSSTLTGEGTGLVASASVADRADNVTSATSSPAVKIDRTPPTTDANATDLWTNTGQTVTLTPADALSGVAATYWRLDGGSASSGTTVAVTDEGDHTLEFWSVDVAGNTEAARSATVRVDRTSPTITHTQDPPANAYGWNAGDVTVSFVCADALSGVASCTSDRLVSTEGAAQPVPGVAADRAGNRADDPATVSIDRTAPTISLVGDAPSGWSRVPLTLTFDCGDGLSGVLDCVRSLHFGEGADQSGTATVRDAAGHTSARTVSGVNVDVTPPTLRGSASSGWHRGDVTVDWTCEDALSGVDGDASFSTLVTGEGENLSSSAGCRDVAGHETTTTVDGVRVDRTAPATVASVPPSLPSGWYAGPVEVTLSGDDNLSGVARTSYRVDGGDAQPYEGPFTHGLTGTHTLTFWSVDEAGNVEDAETPGHTLTLRVDGIAPGITGSRTPAANADGWSNSPVTVSFACEDGQSGVASCTAPVTLSGEGEGQSVTGTATDHAGNTAGATVDGVDIDLTAPTTQADVPAATAGGWHPGSVDVTLTGSDALSGVEATFYRLDDGSALPYETPVTVTGSGRHTVRYWSADVAGNVEASHELSLLVDATPPTVVGSRTPVANAHGWNNEPVTVHFDCADEHSGLAWCTPDETLGNEGAGQERTGTAFDRAGHLASATVGGINVDLTGPALTGVPTVPANAAGWYRDDVTVRWTATDALSGVDEATTPGDSVVTDEGGAVSTPTVRVLDNAGNETEASLGGLRIDKTRPTIQGRTDRAANDAGWYRAPVTVSFACDDNLSGVVSCPADSVVDTDGAGQSVRRTVADYAGNDATVTVGGVDLDSKAPETTGELVCTGLNDWCTDHSATVRLTATDQPGLSGVKQIRYTIAGSAERTVDGDSATVNVPLDGAGTAHVAFRAVDHAGNVEETGGVDVAYDTMAPTVTARLSPTPNGAGWTRADTTVHFDAVDQDGGSGVDPSSVTPDETLTQETPGRTVVGTASDLAGNRADDVTATVRLDRTKPVLTAAATTDPNANGWYAGPVTVRFSCGDALSGVAGSCPADQVVTQNGSGQSVSAWVEDRAGNRETVTRSGIDVDSVAPVVTVASVANGAVYVLGAVPRPTCSARDALSGLDGACTVTVTGGLRNGVGTFSYTATARDRAGNVTRVTGTYRVVYRFGGFLNPINNPGHGSSPSVFKGGSTVPVKITLATADGTPVSATTAPVWLTSGQVGVVAMPVNELPSTSAGTSGGSYRWESEGRHYQYDWDTARSQSGYVWNVGVMLDDGSTYWVSIALR